ncbi:type VI secretion system baseplate subunit TssK [Pseudomonas sp. 148P]|uniref:Type VI secretion system baseplate subunit TssK n=1 Tax=Pseudomonas ulcerans TaxID=3115852 RepID=A0ABU7HUI6_9PSED|nr:MULTISPECIES: type VI secretion system baseplate subunit TssK [unclassified Pseudomonas]MEE1924026.1 type VI secretion system baseplate subunit TssK [Pseudomonas sp. 147P]MEE1935211.1 type VI secretion system baseplate subunit TssK [Pseudomonas sp. 148P]
MNTDKVVWKEGMLLRPQHFQQNDRYHAHQLNSRTLLLSSHGAGFFSLKLDTGFLRFAKIVVRHACGILPDGSYFELKEEHGTLSLDVPHSTSDQPVYLGLPLLGCSPAETRTATQADTLARYVSHEAEVADCNAGGQTRSTLSCARPDLKLMLGEQSHDSAFVKLKVCHIQSVDNLQAALLDARFQPSYLHIRACEPLTACVDQVINQLKSRGDAIAERMRSTGQIGGAELGDFMMLQLINRSELLLRHFQASDQLHPEQVYRSLLALLGELSTFSSERRPVAGHGGYDHQRQLDCFERLRVQIGEVLSLVLEQHAVQLPLQQHKYGVQIARLPDPSFLHSGYFVLVAQAQGETDDLRQRLPQQLKIGTVNSIRDLVNLHLPGIKLSPLPVAPRQIPYHTQKTYFKLEPGPLDVPELESAGGFAFHLSGTFTGLELQFWAIRN